MKCDKCGGPLELAPYTGQSKTSSTYVSCGSCRLMWSLKAPNYFNPGYTQQKIASDAIRSKMQQQMAAIEEEKSNTKNIMATMTPRKLYNILGDYVIGQVKREPYEDLFSQHFTDILSSPLLRTMSRLH
jgi:hypothetical protein